MLTREAQPVIRCRNRDLSLPLAGAGRSMRRMQKVTGRLDDMIMLRGANVYLSQIEEQILAIPEFAPHFQPKMFRGGPMDSMTTAVEANPPSSDAETAAGWPAVCKNGSKT